MTKDEATIRKVPECRIIAAPRPNPTLSAKQIALNMIPEIIEGLTKPLTDKEKYSAKVIPPRPPRIAFEGTYDEVQNFFVGDLNAFEDIEPHSRWTDGLPIVPPTPERVAE
ncbi:MAG: hypothetical protein NTV30_01425, partial [Chloroflexi bacterium]|nr:hypothetical protein [Chloroflexota bacterium]